MNHDFDNETDNDMDDDDAEEVPCTPKAPKNGAAAKPTKKSSMKESERKKRELITMGKQKGFVTYDEVNDAHARGRRLVRPDRRLAVGARRDGIEVVDRRRKLKVAEKGDTEAETEDAEEAAEATSKKEEAEDEDDADGYSKTNDPVRMYLRKMGSVSLLTREGEVEIAKRIEDGERKC